MALIQLIEHKPQSVHHDFLVFRVNCFLFLIKYNLISQLASNVQSQKCSIGFQSGDSLIHLIISTFCYRRNVFINSTFQVIVALPFFRLQMAIYAFVRYRNSRIYCCSLMCISGPGLPTRHLVTLPPACFTLGFRYLTLKIIVCSCMGIFSSIQYISEDKEIYSNFQGIIIFPNFYSKGICNDRDRENSSFYSLYLYHIYPFYIFVKSFFFH